MKQTFHITLFSIILAISCSNSFAGPALTFKNAWIAEAPPVSKVLAAYMVIINDSDKPVIIHSIESEDFDRIEIHRTIHKDSIARMQHMKTLSIPASGNIKLEPGGYHMMLFNPKKKFRAGDVSVFTIKTQDGQRHEIKVPVKKSDRQSDHEHHQH